MEEQDRALVAERWAAYRAAARGKQYTRVYVEVVSTEDERPTGGKLWVTLRFRARSGKLETTRIEWSDQNPVVWLDYPSSLVPSPTDDGYGHPATPPDRTAGYLYLWDPHADTEQQIFIEDPKWPTSLAMPLRTPSAPKADPDRIEPYKRYRVWPAQVLLHAGERPVDLSDWLQAKPDQDILVRAGSLEIALSDAAKNRLEAGSYVEVKKP